jgi:hypothetical protein
MLMDVEAWYATARAIALEGREEGLLGSFHTHPDSTDGRPSDADLSAWLMMRDYAERHGSSSAVPHVGLIYTLRSAYDERSWARPALHAYIVQREGYGRRPVCRPVAIRQR